jgi:hypothetical protein
MAYKVQGGCGGFTAAGEGVAGGKRERPETPLQGAGECGSLQEGATPVATTGTR